MFTIDQVFDTPSTDLSGYTSQELIDYKQFTDLDLFDAFMIVDANGADGWYRNPRQRQGGTIVDANAASLAITKRDREKRVQELTRFYNPRTGAFCCTPKELYPTLTPDKVSY